MPLLTPAFISITLLKYWPVLLGKYCTNKSIALTALEDCDLCLRPIEIGRKVHTQKNQIHTHRIQRNFDPLPFLNQLKVGGYQLVYAFCVC